ncbi:MAG: phage portal protein [Thermoleophilia bacterium]|nr:phage portal protein [Thermoleophilia bacterium]
MGLLDFFRGRSSGSATEWPFSSYDPAQRGLPDPYEPYMGTHAGPFLIADPGSPLLHPEQARKGVEFLWKTQPNVRKVVDFCARNIASIPLHTFERVSDTDRQRVTGHPLSDLCGTPRPGVASFRFWHSVMSDALLYDRWAALKVPRPQGEGVDLIQVPSWRLRLDTDGLRRVTSAWYWVGDEAELPQDIDGWRPLDLDLLVFDHGFAPQTAGLSPLDTLSDVLAETSEAVRYRRQVWANGARVPAWIERPLTAPQWSQTAHDRFAASFKGAYSGSGPKAGGVPILEDGMRLNSSDAFKPQDTMDLEGRRLSAIEVAAAYHIAPELVGAQQGNYSNVKEFRQMLYRDSLGPYIVAWEGVLNAQLVPEMAGPRRLYVEANVEAKLRGSFEEQAQILQSAVGAPWMSRSEARARMNLPQISDADDLVVPLNVLVGGQASPRDSAPKQETATRITDAAALVRPGIDPDDALRASGLEPVFKPPAQSPPV